MSLEDLIERWVRPEIRTLSAYHVPDSAGMVKLDAMENPYGWPPELREAWMRTLRNVEVNRYPDPHARELSAALREAMAVPEGAEVLLGNGSDEIIQMLAMTLGGPGRTLLTVEPGFVMYSMIARFTGMDYHGVPLRSGDFSLDTEALLAAIERFAPALIFLAVPNNPTGNLFGSEDLLRIVEAAPGLVVVDEAYAPFTDTTLMPRVGDYPNLAVMRTVSKMGLAGLRLGLLAAPPQWIAEIDKTRLPYNINVMTQVSGAFAMAHREVLADQTRRIRADRERLFADLTGVPGITPYRSEANFILLRTPRGNATGIFESLQASGILIKKLDGGHPLLTDCLRVTVGTPDENAAFMTALDTAVAI